MRRRLGLTIVVLAFGWLTNVGAKPLVIELTVFDARTSTSSLGNISGTSALFRVTSDTQYVTVDGSGNITFPASIIDVTVLGTPIGPIHGVIAMSDMRVLIGSGEITITMPLGSPLITQGIRAQVAALNGYQSSTSLTLSPAQVASTFVTGLPVSGRLSWVPDNPSVGLLGAGGVAPLPNPAGTLAISIIEPASVPATSSTTLMLLALLIVASGWVLFRRRI